MLIPIELTQNLELSDKNIERQHFRDWNVKESDIEKFLADNIELLAVDETMLIVGQQVRNQEKGRCDLVALDGNGNLVLIEMKRDADDAKNRRESFEFQAIRYAASIASIQTIDELVEQIFAPYIEKNKENFDLKDEESPHELGKRLIMDLLKEKKADRTFNQKQRIFLVASDFDPQTLSACAWLIRNQVDISCFRLIPYKMDSQHFLQIEQVLPVPELEDFYVRIAEVKTRESDSPQKRSRTSLPRMDKLFEWGIVEIGDILRIQGYPDSEATVCSQNEVEYKGERLRFNKWGQKVTGWSSICIYEWAFSERLGQLLDTARREKLKELDTTDDAG